MRVNPLFGAGSAGKSLVVTAARRLNVYYENRSDKDKTPIAAYGTPGMKKSFALGSTVTAARGLLGASGFLYAVMGNTFDQTTPSGVILGSGSLLTNAGLVSLAANAPSQILTVDGLAGYIWASGVLTQISSVAFPNGCRTCVFLGNYFVVEVPGTQNFAVSNFNDGTTWNALALGSASLYPDSILAVDAYQGNLVPFGTLHTEFWQNVGATPQPFAPIVSATAEWGLGAIFSRVHANNCLYFLGASPQGGYSICEINGFNVKAVSGTDEDAIINSFSQVSDCVGLVYRADQHPMVQFTFPAANRSLLFDCLTRLWSETQTGLTPAYAQRHIGNLSANAGGVQLISDYANNNFYVPDPGTFTDNLQTIKRQIVTKHHLKDFNEFSIEEAFVDMETGVGLASGQGSNPQIQLEVSKNDGRTWLTPRLSPIQAMGNYVRVPPWRRLGSARTFTFRLTVTDPIKYVMTSQATSERVRAQP